MPGLIEDKQNEMVEAPAAAEPQSAEQPSQGLSTSPQSIMDNLHLQPQQRQQLESIVAAGKKVLYSDQTHGLVMQQLQGEGDLAQKIGEGVAGLLGMLVQEAKGSLPGELLVPAGLVLVAEAADFLRQTGQQVSDVDVGNAMQVMVGAMLQAVGLNEDKIAEIGARGLQGGAPTEPVANAQAPGAEVA